MTKTKRNLILAIAVTASVITAGYATQRHSYDDALPAAEGVEIPQIVIVAKREHATKQHR